MCWSCVEEEVTEPVTLTAAHMAVADDVSALHATDWGAVGGPLHIVTDDTNVEDSDLEFCARATAEMAGQIGPDGVALCERILAGLRAMTEGERAVVVNVSGWYGQPHDYPVGTVFTPLGEDHVVLSSVWPRVTT